MVANPITRESEAGEWAPNLDQSLTRG
jgi:hypothetical protein